MRRRYSDSLKRTLDEAAIRNPSFEMKERLRRLVMALIEKYDPEAVILTGSLAEGKWVRGLSDVDLLIITEQARNMAHADHFELNSLDGVDVHIGIYTLGDIAAGIKSLNFFFIDAVDRGVPLHGRRLFTGLRSLLREEAEKVKLTKEEGGWSFQGSEIGGE